MIVLDDLDKKALEHFRGFVVKKDLVGIIKGGAMYRPLYWNIYWPIRAAPKMKNNSKKEWRM